MGKITPLLLAFLLQLSPSAVPGRTPSALPERASAEARVPGSELLRLRRLLRPFGILQAAERTPYQGSAVHSVYRCRVLDGTNGEERSLLVKFLDADARTVQGHFPHLGEIRELATSLRLRPGDGVEVPLLGDFCPCRLGGRCAYLVVEDFGDRTALRSVLRSNRIDLQRRAQAMAVLGSALAHFHHGNGALVSAPSPLLVRAPRHGDLNFNNFAFSRDRRSVFFLDTLGLQIASCGEDLADVVYYICRDFAAGNLGRGDGEPPATLEDCKKLVGAFLDSYAQRATALLPEKILQRVDVRRFVAHHAGDGLARLANGLDRPEAREGESGGTFLAGYRNWLAELGINGEEPAGR
ncbi:MAG: hypothetical protein LBT98_03000 [Puniceicoccales bacterium]|jgi:hypothetical protein|nr:hypothetical protein [Puniceicoccales bacterium]